MSAVDWRLEARLSRFPDEAVLSDAEVATSSRRREQELVERARRGDVDAYESLLLQHERLAYRLAFLITRDAADAEDALQEAFVKAFRALGRFRRGAPFRPWLLKIVTNEARTKSRSHRRHAAIASRVSERGPTAPGREVSFAGARARVSFPVLVPKDDREPSHTLFFASDPPGGQISLVYGSLRRPRLLVTEFIGTKVEGSFSKKAGRRTSVERVRVSGGPGIWLGGAKHTFSFLDGAGMTRDWETRLAGNTLVWERGGLTLRLEGDLSRARAIRLAESFVPAR